MINGKKVLAFIPARGGSKGVPKKNIVPLAGKPLIAWTIEEARKSRYIDRCIISTDDDLIIEVVKALNGDVPFKRPKELAEDHTPGVAPLLHALDQLPGYDYVVMLQPTSPLRMYEDIDGCIELCIQSGAPIAVSIAEPDSSPYWMFNKDENSTLHSIMGGVPAVRRQDLPETYSLNGAVYVADVKRIEAEKSLVIEGMVGYVMPKERSIDIDSEMDFVLCEWLLEREMVRKSGGY